MTLFIYRAFYDRDNTVDELFHVLPIPYLGEILFLQKNTDLFCISLYPGDRLFLESNVSGISDKEHGGKPHAADTRGLNVDALRYMAVIFSGMMAGLAGSFLTNGISSRFMPEMTAGRGWLAIIIVIAGNWRLLRILAATLIFAFLYAFQFTLPGVGTDIPFQLLLAMPYIIALIALMSSRMRSRMLGVLGVPYRKE
jgi:simple sugar transport system permease protein